MVHHLFGILCAAWRNVFYAQKYLRAAKKNHLMSFLKSQTQDYISTQSFFCIVTFNKPDDFFSSSFVFLV